MPAATQPPLTRLSVSEYLATTFRPDCEYLDGEIQERNVGERTHSELQGRLYALLLRNELETGLHPLLEQRVQVKRSRFRIPDICALAAGAPYEEVITHPPFLCIEILSKDDTMSSMQERISDYLQMGVPQVWVIDPAARRGYHYTAELMKEAKDGILHTDAPDLAIPLGSLFD